MTPSETRINVALVVEDWVVQRLANLDTATLARAIRSGKVALLQRIVFPYLPAKTLANKAVRAHGLH